jgi:hypothetical protein
MALLTFSGGIVSPSGASVAAGVMMPPWLVRTLATASNS